MLRQRLNSGLFEYVNMFLKLKQDSSGYPSWVECEADKDQYVEDYRRAEGIPLDKASNSKIPDQRTGENKIELDVGKMDSNTEQNPDNLCEPSVKDVYELLKSPSTEVANRIFPNVVVWLYWKHTE